MRLSSDRWAGIFEKAASPLWLSGDWAGVELVMFILIHALLMSHLGMRRNSCRRREESCQAPLKHTACLNPLASASCLHTLTSVDRSVHVTLTQTNTSITTHSTFHEHTHPPPYPFLSFSLIFVHSALGIRYSFYLALGKIQPKSHSTFIKLSFHSTFFGLPDFRFELPLQALATWAHHHTTAWGRSFAPRRTSLQIAFTLSYIHPSNPPNTPPPLLSW